MKDNTKEKVNIKHLQESIDGLEERIDRVNSIKSIFFKGVLRGLGSVFGATIVFAILISLLSWFISSTEIIWINEAIQAVGLADMFNK